MVSWLVHHQAADSPPPHRRHHANHRQNHQFQFQNRLLPLIQKFQNRASKKRIAVVYGV